MKWFKHMTDMLDDTFIHRLMDEFGVAGYGIWVGVLELYGKYAKENCGGWVSIPKTLAEQKLRTKRSTIGRLMLRCQSAGKLEFKESGLDLELRIPKMAEFKDEWAARKNKNSGVARELLSPKKEEIRIKKEEIPPVSPLGGQRASRLPEDWEPDDALLTWALEKHSTVDTRQQTERFKLHFLANGKRMIDWRRAWQNWIARSKEFGRPTPPTPPPATPKQEHWKLITSAKSIENLFDSNDIRDGTDYLYHSLTGRDAQLMHKTTGEKIRCGDYKVNSS